jgi:branched-chain amino acid transport system substrate-binding protein
MYIDCIAHQPEGRAFLIRQTWMETNMELSRFHTRLIKSAAVAALAGSAVLANAETVRVAFIDPLSGTFAAIGENELRSFHAVAKLANSEKWAGEHTLEFVGFDNKANPQESLVQLQRAIDQGFRYVTQANGSGVALALIAAINKHNQRNPGKEVVYLNHGAVDPRLTNAECSFWHFRFDADANMKTRALVAYMASQPAVKKVYVLNQDYAAGHGFTAATKEYVASAAGARPDLQIVGEDLHPLGQVRDFAPYVAKIQASGADTLITGNWGADLALLVRAVKDAGLNINIFTYYADLKGTPTAIGPAGEGRIRNVGIWTINNDGFVGEDIAATFKKDYNDDFVWSVSYTIVSMLSKAIKTAGSTDPIKIAYALEGMRDNVLNGDVEMRAADHQLMQPLFITSLVKADGKVVKYETEGTGLGWKAEQKLEPDVAALPTSCQMKRPPAP